MALAVEDICNAALRRAKYPTPIGSIYEGSRASRVALDYYGEIRDAILRDQDWGFARQTVSLGAALKTYSGGAWNPATNPPLPWQYEYAYPANCIMVRAVRPVPTTVPERNPLPNRFDVGNDSSSGSLVVLTNLANAAAVITAKVTDPSQWNDAGFLEALIAALAAEFTKNLLDEQQPVQIAERDAQQAAAAGVVRLG